MRLLNIPILQLITLEVPSDLGGWFTEHLHVERDRQARLHRDRVEVCAVDAGLHCNISLISNRILYIIAS